MRHVGYEKRAHEGGHAKYTQEAEEGAVWGYTLRMTLPC